MKSKLKIFILIFLLCGLTGGRAAAADKSSTITITPFLREVRFSADEGTKDFEVVIGNDSDKTQDIKLSVLDFGSLNDTGGLVFAGTNASELVKKYGLAEWLQLSESDLSIEAGKTAVVQASIIDDVSLAPGGHYAAIVASIDSGAGTTSNQISVNQKISSLIFATKTGGEKYDLKLDSIDTGNKRFTLPGYITLHFSNPGNVHVIPRGTVKIISPDGEVVSQGIINEDSGYILPETSRQMLVKLNTVGRKDLRASAYKLRVEYRYDGIDNFAVQERPLYITNLFGIVPLVLIFSVAAYLFIKQGILMRIKKFARGYYKSKILK